MSEVRNWLEGIGLVQYAEAFEANDIDMELFEEIDDQVLKDIGVSSAGHRLRIRKAIAKRDPRSDVEATSNNAESTTEAGARAERRQLTVMFSDLVGSTSLSARLDPEDMRDIIGALHRRCAEVITQSGGFVAKYMGDGVLAYFGYPQAHEDDAERAVRSALALTEAIPKLATAHNAVLRVRVGIATGLVVVGDLIGEGDAQERGVVGDTPNLSARLQALAEPDQVVISESTRRLTAGLFDYRDLGTVALKGFADTVQAWQVLGTSAVQSRFEAQHGTALTPLVGREEELDLLLRRWEQAKSGDGCVVLISGEPGIGKSRIAQTVVERVSGEPHSRLRYFCTPHHQDSALYPIITQLERAAGFRREDTNEQRLDKLEAVLAQATKDISEAAPLLADLLSIPTGAAYPPLNLSPQKRKEKTLKALLAQINGLAAQQPVLMIFEDAHWIDPTSREALELVIDHVAALPVLVIVTFRPEFTPPWVGRPQVTLISLNRLPPRRCAEVITRVTGGKVLPKEITDQIVNRTDGVPLFIEELTKAVVESGVLTDAGDHYTVMGPLPPLAIPMSLHASLLSRLDRLASVREVAQIAAALGRQFSHELISAVACMAQRQLDDALAQLVGAELIFRRGTPPDAEYAFKHVLVQDAAYSTLLRGARQRLHARIAKAFEERCPEVAVTQPELLAYHSAEGGLIETAVDYWFAAGQRSVRTLANVEAIKHLSQGLHLLTSSLPDTPERQRKELRFQTALGPALLATKGWAAPEAAQAYYRADELCRALGDSGERVKIISGLWSIHNGRGENHKARELSDELFRLAEQENDDDLRLQAHHSAWGSLTWLGEFAAAREHANQGLALYSLAKHGAHALTYIGHDPGVCGWAHGGLDLWFLGYPDRAAENLRRSVTLGEQIAHPPTVAHALNYGIICHELRGDEAMVRAWGDRMAELAAEQGLALYEALALVARGWLLANQGHAKSSFLELHRGSNGCVALGMRMFEPYHSALLAAAYLGAGEAPVGLELVEDAKRFADESGMLYWDAELLRLKGKLLAHLAPGRPQEVEACYREALAVARRQQARSLELRAATSLACHWRNQGKHAEARDLLAPVYNWFTEGFDTPVLQEAKTLLEQLTA